MIVIKVNYTTDAPIIKVNYDDAPIYISTSVDATYISVDYGSGAATNAVWGDITGTLSNQTDLQNALDAKVPYTGAIANVDLGEYELKAGQVEFDQTPTGTAGVAVTRWNDTVGTIETTLKGGNVILRHGRDMFERVVNKTGIQLTKAAYQAVRISDAQGQRLAVQLAQANNDNNSADTIGLVVETIDNNQEGYIYTVGELQNINTTGSLQGETWADGDVLYLSPTIAGRITNVKPVAPQHLVVIGYVVYAHQNNGKIFVKITNGFELGELHDVDTTGATNGQVLTYNGTIWTPQTNAAGNIYNTDGTLTGNRTVTMGTNTLSFTRDLLVNGITVGIGNIGDNTRYNTVLGWRALFNPTSKSRNTAIGSESLTSATTGSFNTAVGNESLYALTTGTENTAVGDLGLDSVTTGAGNVSLGAFAMRHLVTGNYNIGIGYDTNLGVDTTAGSYNTLLGAQSTIGDTSGSNNTVLGARVNAFGNYSNNIILADGSGNMRLVFNSSGDAILGGSTTYPTFSGFKLDVLGSGRYSGNLTLTTLGGIGTRMVVANATGVLSTQAIPTGTVTSVGLTSSTSGITITGSPVTSSGSLNFEIATASGTQNGLLSSTDWTTFNNKQNALTNPITGTGANGQVAYWSGTNTQTGSATFTFSPTAQLLLNNSVTAASAIARGANFTPTLVAAANNDVLVGLDVNPTFTNGAFTGITNYGIRNSSSDTLLRNFIFSSGGINYQGTNTTITGFSNQFFLRNTAASGFVSLHADGASGSIRFHGAGIVEYGRIFANTGNLLLQNGGTFTDGGQRLQVQGDAFIRGSGNTSATTALTIQNSSAAQLLTMQNDGVLVLGSFAAYPQLRFINNNTRIAVDAAGTTSFVVNNGVVATQLQIIGTSNLPNTSTSGSTIGTNINIGFAPTSGTASWVLLNLASTINQTGGANGITRGLYVNPTLTAAADWRSVEWSNNTGWGLYGAGTSANYLNGRLGLGSTALTGYGLRNSLPLTGAIVSFGHRNNGVVQSDVTFSAQYLNIAPSTQAAAFTVTNVFGILIDPLTVGAGSTVTNAYAFYGDFASGTNRWNLYCNGTANNYMAGSLGVGSTTLTGYNLNVSKTITGATTAYGVFSSGAVQSDVTSSARYFQSVASTQATTFTLNTLFHYIALQNPFGAGSTVNNQYGFTVSNTLTSATNNYGFYADIASGTGRWNFFANGTAANYLNGNTIIGGSAVDGGQKLQVNGTTQMTPAADASALTVSGYSVTGSGTTPAISVTGTFNTTGNVSGILMNITNTASSSNASLLRLQISGTDIFRVQANAIGGITGTSGPVSASGYGLGSGLVSIFTVDSTGVPSTSGTAIRIGDALASSSGYSYVFASQQYISRSYTSGTGGFISIERGFAPTSGTGVFNVMLLQNTINQTGGANGITRGLYINPTLTAAADWRSIETSNNSGWSYYGAGTANSYYGGHISIGTTSTGDWLNIAAGTTAKAQINLAASTAPTSPQNGDIWFDGTDLKMRIGGVTKTFTLV